MRVFAGPNGSGKSTIFNQISSQFDIGIYINSDDIEQQLTSQGIVQLNDYNIEINKKSFHNYIKKHSLVEKAKKEGFNLDLKLSENIIYPMSKILVPMKLLLFQILSELN